ncbi:hypothetical protein P5G65_01695 [Paenibacillus chondroitinus]|uniref:DUF4190 domain-containing protein n=1 Tax=Paenibacillus chondroitinus TaxID=59842 RepID=A0ABU6D4E1_9BACL|nr:MULTISPECIES: hypothetical protein [Paenibacillus]MCY9658407.1 hypothetical protein [Paenibacillus anseongense]MEB4792594.1 hypothetical protein [Paenibacillus chondroitinus]
MRQHGGNLDKTTKERFQREQLRTESGLNSKEEYAAEITAPSRRIHYAEPYQAKHAEVEKSEVSDEEIDDLVEAVTRNKAVGYIALFVALASLFVWPVLLGVSGIILGVIAFLMGNKGIGTWSVVLGFIAVAAYFLLFPFYS